MRTRLFSFISFTILVIGLTGCNVFAKPKQGCPSNGKNIGAERLLSGEKVPKAKKFRN